MKLIKESLYEKFTRDSDPIKDLGIGPIGIGPIYHYFNVKKTNRAYYFTEKGPDYVREDKPTTYIYSIEKGNVYRKHPSQWAQQELRSNSRAFNKGNPDKMAIPNDVEKAKEFIYNHYMRLRKEAGLKESLNEKFSMEGDPLYDMGVGMLPQFEKQLKEKYKYNYGSWVELKDTNRIRDIKSKAEGNVEKENKLAETMCKLIKDPLKAYRRFLAAKEFGGTEWEVTKIFLRRAAELAQIEQ